MLELAQIVAVNPGKQTVEIVLCRTGAPFGNVKVAGGVSSDGGDWGIPSVRRPPSQQQSGGLTSPGRKLLGLVGNVSGRWVLLGLVRSADGFAVTEQDRKISHHPASGSYATVAPDGSIEAFHASGAYFRIGAGPHAAVPGVPPPAGAPAPTITLHTSNFNMTVDTSGNATFTSPQFTFNGPMRINGPISQAAGTGGAGAVTMVGPVTVTNDLTAQGTSVHTHAHGGVQPGGGTSGPPV
jgi:phage baseplate assembly protein gpV